MPRLLYALSFGNFAIGSGAFMIAALVAPIAAGMHVPLSDAGRLLAIYAGAYAIASPILITWVGAAQRRPLLLLAISVFTLGCVLCAVAPNFLALEAGRIVMALGAAVFTPIAAATGAQAAPPEKRGSALALVFIGLSLAQVFGVPAAGPIAEHFGWRAAFWAVAGVAVVAGVVIALMSPKAMKGQATPLGALLRAARQPALIAGLAVIAFQMAANFSVFTYFGPMLAKMTGLDKTAIAALFWAFGMSAVVGAWFGGWLNDRLGADRTLMIVIAGLAATLAVFNAASGSAFATGLAVVVFAFFGFAVNAPQQARIMGLAGAAFAPALALNASALYVGTAFGGAAAGLFVHGPDPDFTPLASLGVGFALLALLALEASRRFAARAAARVSPA